MSPPQPVVPVFVNSVARPFVPVARVRKFGHAVGEYFRSRTSACCSSVPAACPTTRRCRRSPPPPPDQREFLTAGRHPSPEARAARQAKHHRDRPPIRRGSGRHHGPQPRVGQRVPEGVHVGPGGGLRRLHRRRHGRAAGHSSHEVRTWVAAYSALRACGDYDVTYEFYRPIPEYIAGIRRHHRRPALRRPLPDSIRQ